MKIRNSIAVCTTFVSVLAFSGAAHALIIDSFDDDVLVLVSTAAPSTLAAATPDSGVNMIGDRNITVEKTVGPSGAVNAAIAEVSGGVLGMSNGPATNSIIDVDWTFAATDLTEGGTATGLFLSLPNPIDNDLDIAFSLNGMAAFSQTFPDGSSGNDFFIPFASLTGDATAATSLNIQFSDGLAWDAQIDFIETRPEITETPEPGILALLGIAAFGFAGMRRRKY